MSFLSKLRTPVYAASGSVARDHLASERTYLAWMRTGLGFIALSIAIERFSQLDIPRLMAQFEHIGRGTTLPAEPSTSPARPPQTKHEEILVGSLLGTGMGSIAYGTVRYFSVMRLLGKGQFKPAYYGAGILGVTIASLGSVAYVTTLRDEVKKEASHDRDRN